MTNPTFTWRQAILDAMPAATPEIAHVIGAHRNVVNRWTARLHAAGEIHITGWVRWQGGPLPIYTAGPGVDVVCLLRPYTAQQNYNRFKRKARANGYWEEVKAKLRGRAAARRAEQRGFAHDPLLGLFFGAVKQPDV